MQVVSEKRRAIKAKQSGSFWCSIQKRKGFTKITTNVKDALVQWILKHPQVRDSPIAKDCLKIKVTGTDKKEVVHKKLFQISVRELYNDLIKPEDQGGLKEAKDASGNVIIGLTTLRYLMPPQVKK